MFNKSVFFINQFNPLRGIYGFSIAYYLIGMKIGSSGFRLKSARPFVKLLAICAMAPIGLALYKMAFEKLAGAAYDAVWGGYSSVTTLLLTVSFYYLSGFLAEKTGKHGRIRGVITYLGANSFAVYLLHIVLRPLMISVTQAVQPALLASAVSVLLAMATVIVLSVVGSLLCKTKSGRWLLRV